MCFIPNHFHILNIDLKCKLQTFILLLGERTCIFSRNDYLTIIFFSAVGALWHTSDMAKGGGLCKRSILNLNWSYKTKNDPEINWEKLTEKPYYVSIWCDDNNLENKWSIIYFIKCIIKKRDIYHHCYNYCHTGQMCVFFVCLFFPSVSALIERVF